jgi:hypothetical protein
MHTCVCICSAIFFSARWKETNGIDDELDEHRKEMKKNDILFPVLPFLPSFYQLSTHALRQHSSPATSQLLLHGHDQCGFILFVQKATSHPVPIFIPMFLFFLVILYLEHLHRRPLNSHRQRRRHLRMGTSALHPLFEDVVFIPVPPNRRPR